MDGAGNPRTVSPCSGSARRATGARNPICDPYDLRHHFASRLVQKGVPLNTVRDLLGHGSVGMSLRYAHLAPDQRREAVAKLNEKPLLTLTMRLQWEGLSVASGYRVDSIVVREGQEVPGQVPLSGNLAVSELRL